MRFLGKLLRNIFWGINAIAAILLIFSAYSSCLNPCIHPVVACAGLFFPVCLILNFSFGVFWLIVYRKYVFFPILVLAVCWGSIRTYCPINWFKTDAPGGSLKILSYNTRAFGLKASHTKEKSNQVLTYLQECDADVICLQEYIWGGKLKKKDIDYALRKYRYKHYQSLGKGLNGLGVYSRYPILSAVSIPYKSNRNGSVAYRIKIGQDTLLVVNNHLESTKILESDVATYQDMVDAPDSQKLFAGTRKLLRKLADATVIRSKQTDVLADYIKNAKEENIVVCGDFNDTPISYTHHVLQKGLKDAFVESGNGLGISYNQNRLYFRIDHILVSQSMNVYNCTVDKTINASDHYPIWCNVSLQ